MSMSAMKRAVALGALLVGAAVGLAQPAGAADPRGLPPPLPPPAVETMAVEPGVQSVQLGVGKSVVIDLPRDVKDVLVANPEIANAVIRSSRRAYLIGGKIGQTNIYFFDETGAQIVGYDIAVTRDLNGLRATLRRMFPQGDVSIEGAGEGVMLTGTVTSPSDAQQAFDLAVRLVGTDTKVLNAIAVKGRDQVMLKVTVAEVQRDIIKQLGINLDGTIGSGNAVLNLSTSNPFSAYGGDLSGTAFTGTFGKVTATLKAMERAGVIRTLAEPNLSAVSGESATFLAGGEFPIPGGLTCDQTGRNCQVAVQFKKFGIGLAFTPVVLSEGRISLKVMTEVSDLSNENSMTLQPTIGGPTVTIPSIRTRRAETVVEIPSGGMLAMAGMIQEQTKQAINGVPGLLQLPVLGTLFRSRDYVNRESELMIMVAPYTVRSVAPKGLSRPDDGYADISDPSAVLLGRLNKIYGVSGSADPSRTYFGKYGFILD
ncbi:MAG: type II and III secretion system protein family protein [Rhodoplanes sp.]|nr:type II and III secretion system protein family protein [Rhodoplanes sp.]